MKLHIIAAIVDTSNLTLYLKDGSTKKIPQGNPLLAKILEAVTPQLLLHKEAFYDFEEPNTDSDYVEFQGRTNGVVQFFKIAKQKLAAFLAEAEEAPIVAPVTIGEVSPEAYKMKAVVAEIIGASEKMIEQAVEQTHSVVAVVGNSMIPDADALSNQIKDSNANSSTGLENFMKRVAAVASKRMHSVQDLMKFMKRGDLPIADDGSIIIYKILTKKKNGKHTYVDCHTKLVPQSVGSYVHMDELLVDHNRNNECSNGLHVARRGYLNNFNGDVCVLAKVAPEDVIAVPSYDANKMRVCGYHILFEIPNDSFVKLKANKAMTDDDMGKVLLGKAISGDHVGIIDEVLITQQNGKGVVLKEVMDEAEAAESITANIVTSVDATAEAISLDDDNSKTTPKAPVVMPTNVVQDVMETKDTIANLPTRLETAQQLYKDYKEAANEGKEQAFKKLEEFKKKCKCSWDTLGLPNFDAKTTSKEKATKVTKEKAPVSRQEKVTKMMKNIMKATDSKKKTLALELQTYKRACKVSYESLGLNAEDIALINKLTK